ncbi:MAG: hypothetical protein F6Q13_11410 [Mycobacterium sp.]|nr:MAG: hypothetical protein F6Q13_11410 [Mycobacterium sp.]
MANDYELLVRSFPTTRFVHIPRHYEQRIHARLLELGVDDFIWTPNGLDYTRPRPEPESHCSMVLQS